MNFDDILNGGLSSKSNIGETITDIFGVNEKFAKQTTQDLVDLCYKTEATDADVIQSVLATCETKEEVAVVMHLTCKALVDILYSKAEEAGELLEDTQSVIESMGEEFVAKYAEGMIEALIKRHGQGGIEDRLRDFFDNGE